MNMSEFKKLISTGNTFKSSNKDFKGLTLKGVKNIKPFGDVVASSDFIEFRRKDTVDCILSLKDIIQTYESLENLNKDQAEKAFLNELTLLK